MVPPPTVYVALPQRPDVSVAVTVCVPAAAAVPGEENWPDASDEVDGRFDRPFKRAGSRRVEEIRAVTFTCG